MLTRRGVNKAIQEPAPVREFLEKNNQPMYGDWYSLRFVIESEGQDYATTVDKLRMIEPAPTEADKAYAERNKLVRFLAALYPSGVKKTAIEGWEPEWQNCVFIDTPLGQMSWHQKRRGTLLKKH